MMFERRSKDDNYWKGLGQTRVNTKVNAYELIR